MNAVLYQMNDCPFSAKVRHFIESNGLRSYVEYRDIDKDNEAYAELQSYTQKSQVPCLVVEGCALLDSDEIIDELRALYLTSKAG